MDATKPTSTPCLTSICLANEHMPKIDLGREGNQGKYHTHQQYVISCTGGSNPTISSLMDNNRGTSHSNRLDQLIYLEYVCNPEE